jgi:hypothetical protein
LRKSDRRGGGRKTPDRIKRVLDRFDAVARPGDICRRLLILRELARDPKRYRHIKPIAA